MFNKVAQFDENNGKALFNCSWAFLQLEPTTIQAKILPLWTVSRTDYPSVITKLVPPPPRCDAHLGETSIHQIQTNRPLNYSFMMDLLTSGHSKSNQLVPGLCPTNP